MVVMMMVMLVMMMVMMMMTMMVVMMMVMMMVMRKRRMDHASYPMRSSGYRALSPLYSSKVRSCQLEVRQYLPSPTTDDATGRSCHSELRGTKDEGHS